MSTQRRMIACFMQSNKKVSEIVPNPHESNKLLSLSILQDLHFDLITGFIWNEIKQIKGNGFMFGKVK
jgi:hypothetical protein